MSRSIRHMACLVACLTASGCTTVAPPKAVALGGECATSLSDLPRTRLAYIDPKLEKKGEVPTDYADYARCLQLESQIRIPAAMFELDGVAPPALVRVFLRSDPQHTLAAAITLLDAGFSPLKRAGFSEFKSRGNFYTLDVFINEAEAKTKYVLVTPDEAMVGRSETYISGQTKTIFVVTGSFTYGSESKQQRSLTNMGHMAIYVKPAPALLIGPGPEKK